MSIIVKPLSPELADDFFDFFDNRAFSDNSPEGTCYCTRFQMTKEQEIAASESAGSPGIGSPDFIKMIRECAARQIESGALQGYLAYVDGLSIGWCNCNAKSNFPAVSGNGARLYAPAEKRERVVVCFEVDPHFRGKGVATALLLRAVFDAAAEGYAAIEAFPRKREGRYEWDFTGPIRLYEKLGFAMTEEHDRFVVMRKELNSNACE